MKCYMARPCKGCDGTGAVHVDPIYPLLDAWGREIAHTSHAGSCWCNTKPCGACLGFGVVEDRIPASDAIADAETLHSFAWDGGADVGDLTPAYLDAAYVCLTLDELRGDEYAAPIAQAAARAAFLAVPGLRG